MKSLIVYIILLVLPDTYIYMRYVRHWTSNLCVRLAYFVPTLLLASFMAFLIGANDMRPEIQPVLGWFVYLFVLVTIPKALFALFDGILGLLPARKRRWGHIASMSVALFAVLLLTYGFFIGRDRFVVHHQTFYFHDLPKSFDGYRIVQFSDMHIGTLRDGHEGDADAIVRLVNNQRCDAVCFVGDLVNHQSRELDGFKSALKRLSAPDGVFAVMGNHDYSMYMKYPDESMRKADVQELQRRIRSYGWTLLLNDHRVIRRGGDSIVVAGVENDGRPPFPSLGDLPKAMKGVQKGAFTVLMSHDPTHWRRKVIPETDIQLTLSGHTHAGQFKVFGWSPVALIYGEWSGAYCEGSQILNVSDGVGAVMFPFRFGAWPEINVVTLRVAEEAAGKK